MNPGLHEAAKLVQAAREQGVALWVEGGRLRFRSSAPLTYPLADHLSTWKASIIAFLHDPTLEALCSGLSPEEARDLREERAAILELDAGMSRKEAEARCGL